MTEEAEAERIARAFWARVGQAMEQKGLSQSALAQALDVDETSLSRAINAGKGYERRWPEIAKYLELSLDFLCFGSRPEEQGASSGAYKIVLEEYEREVRSTRLENAQLREDLRRMTGREAPRPPRQ